MVRETTSPLSITRVEYTFERKKIGTRSEIRWRWTLYTCNGIIVNTHRSRFCVQKTDAGVRPIVIIAADA